MFRYSSAISSQTDGATNVAFPEGGVDFEKEVAGAERRYLVAALESAKGIRTEAAGLLNISYRSFRHYAKKHNL